MREGHLFERRAYLIPGELHYQYQNRRRNMTSVTITYFLFRTMAITV